MWSTMSTILFLFQGCCLVVTTERHTIGLAEVYTTLCATHRLSHKILYPCFSKETLVDLFNVAVHHSTTTFRFTRRHFGIIRHFLS